MLLTRYRGTGIVVPVMSMMTSSNGNIFRVAGHFCREFTSYWWIAITKASDAELWCCAWINGWVNNREAGDLRRHRPPYDVTVMKIQRDADNALYSDAWLENHTCICLTGSTVSCQTQWRCYMIPVLWQQLTSLINHLFITALNDNNMKVGWFSICIVSSQNIPALNQ